MENINMGSSSSKTVHFTPEEEQLIKNALYKKVTNGTTVKNSLVSIPGLYNRHVKNIISRKKSSTPKINKPVPVPKAKAPSSQRTKTVKKPKSKAEKKNSPIRKYNSGTRVPNTKSKRLSRKIKSLQKLKQNKFMASRKQYMNSLKANTLKRSQRASKISSTRQQAFQSQKVKKQTKKDVNDLSNMFRKSGISGGPMNTNNNL
jgi:hypothetical protein